MYWTILPPGRPSSWVHDEYRFHDLHDDDDRIVGSIRESITNRNFLIYTGKNTGNLGTVYSLDEAKAILIAHLVKERLDDL